VEQINSQFFGGGNMRVPEKEVVCMYNTQI